MTDYKTFTEAMNYAQQSHSSLIHSVYLHCLLQIVTDLFSVDSLGFQYNTPSSHLPLREASTIILSLFLCVDIHSVYSSQSYLNILINKNDHSRFDSSMIAEYSYH